MLKFGRIEFIFAVLGLLFFTAPLPYELVPSAVDQLYRYFVWGASSLLVLVYHRRALFVAKQAPFLWGVVVLQVLSFIWSLFPATSADTAREVLQTSTFGLYLATRFSLKQQVRLIAIAFGIGGVLSLLLGLGIPSVGIHGADHPGAWKGVYDYKNSLGSYMVVGLATSLLLALDQEKPIKKAWWGVILCFMLILLSTSKTSLVGMFLSLGTVFITRRFRWRGRLAVIVIDLGLLVGSLGVTLLISNWVRLLAGLGKDPTLTGRIPMWGVMIHFIQERPFLGYGRGAFFSGSSPYPRIVGGAISKVFVPPHAHNGFIELALEIGLIGLGLFLLSLGLAYFRAITRAFSARNCGDLWPLVFLTYLVFNNMTETLLLRFSHVYWVLFLSLAISLALPRRQSVPTASAAVAEAEPRSRSRAQISQRPFPNT